MADTTGTSWSDIPLDLAGQILRRLPAHVDRVRFAAMCPQWRAATRHGPLPRPLPLLLLSDGTVYSLPGSQPFHVPGLTGTGYTDACGDWLVSSCQEGFFLRDPFSNATVTPPPLSRARAIRVRRDGRAVWGQILEQRTKEWKLCLCSHDLVVATVQFKGGKRIAVCRARTTSWWSVCLDDHCENLFDMAFHQGKLYALDLHNALVIINLSMNDRGDPWISQMGKVILSPRSVISFLQTRESSYLVESRGVLLLVVRKLRINDTLTDEFVVFKADLSQSKWSKVTTLGNSEVLFLRQRCSRSVCVSHSALPGDCIFFLENDDKDCGGYGTSSSCSVYSMMDGKVSTPLPMVSWTRRTVFGTWLFPRNWSEAETGLGV